MEELVTTSNITFTLGILGILFAVYHYFRNPQIKSDKKDALMSQEAQWAKELNESRFKTMQESIAAGYTLAQNHIHTVQEHVEILTNRVNEMNVTIAKLTTVIEERLPNKKI